MTRGKPSPGEVANRIRQAGSYPKSRKALEHLLATEPELWVPAIIEAVAQDLGEAGSVVEQLIANFAAACTDFPTRFWLYQEIPGKSAHFHRIKTELASWIIQQMDPQHPSNQPLLAQMNLNLSQHLRDGGRVPEAPPYSRAAVELHEALSESDPQLTGDLVWAWMLHAQQLSEAGRDQDAVEANLAAVRVAQRLEGDERNRLLGQACVALGAALIATRQPRLALEPLKNGYRLLQKCRGPEKEYEAIAAPAAVYLADALLDVGRAGEASPFAEEARQGFELLAAREPGVYLKDYLWATNVASRVAIALGQPEKSRSLRYEGVRMLQDLADKYPKAFLEQLLLHLTGLISALINEQQWDEAESLVRPAIRMGRKWGRLTKSKPAIYLGSSYAQLASICLGEDRMEEGLRAALRARFYLRQIPQADLDRNSLLPTVEEQVEVFRRFRKL